MSEATSNRINELTRGSRLARNTALNLLGYCAPMLVAIFAIPPLVKGLGTERFGVLTLAWVLIGYLSLLDLGLSRALTKLVAEKLGAGQEQEIPALVWTAIFVMFFLGVGVATAVSLLLPWMVRSVLNIPLKIQAETLKAFYILAASVPVVIISVGFRGILDAHQRFDLTNAVRTPLGIFSFLAPLLVLPFSQKLSPVVSILVGGRVTACLVQLLLCFHVVPALRFGIILKREMVGPLIRFGSWMTVTNIVSPLMVYLDRFFISALISVAAVTYYAVPNEFVTKLLLISGSLMGVLFPAFSSSFAQNRSHTLVLFDRGVKYIFLFIFPLILLIVAFAEEGLSFWLGVEFAQKSTRVLQYLAIGVFVHSLGQVPYALIQGVGRPDLTAKLHLIELPFYLFFLWLTIISSGIEGTAIAWVGRITVDTMLMFYMAQRLLIGKIGKMRNRIITLGLALFVMLFAILLTGLFMKFFFVFLVLLIFGLTTWFLILIPEERAMIGNRLKTIRC